MLVAGVFDVLWVRVAVDGCDCAVAGSGGMCLGSVVVEVVVVSWVVHQVVQYCGRCISVWWLWWYRSGRREWV